MMVRFQYPFQKILDLKENEKTQAEWMLTDAAHKLREEEGSLETLNHEKDELHHSISGEANGSMPVSHLMLYHQYMNHLDREISRKRSDVQKASMLVEERQGELTEKMKQEKIWSKARERALDAFNLMARRKEQESLDEVATVRFKPIT